MQYSDGTNEEQDEVFDTEEAEILNLSNPGDYPLDDYEAPDFEIVEIDD